MAKKTRCPLCDNTQVEVIEHINADHIIKLWKKRNVDVEYLFNKTPYLDKISCPICGLEYFYPFVCGDDRFYSTLGSEDWYYLYEDRTEFLYSNRYINDGDSILDIGSGSGVFLRYINKKVSYTGLELSSRAVELAKKEGFNVIQTTIEEYSKENANKHDVVVAFQVLEHIADIHSFINSALRTLKKNGFLIIAVPNNSSFLKYAQNNLLNLPPHHLFHWNEKSLKFLSRKFGIEIVDIYKERVANIHKSYFYSVYLSKFIRDIMGIKMKSIDLSFSSIIIQKISSFTSRLLKFIPLYLNRDGHTIIAVFKKT